MVKVISFLIVEGEKLVIKIIDFFFNVNVWEFFGDKLSLVFNILKGILGVLINSMWIYEILYFKNFVSWDIYYKFF